MHTFSASQVNNYTAEPILWALKSLYKLKDAPGGAAIKGTAFGDAVEVSALSNEWPNRVDSIRNQVITQCRLSNVEVPSMEHLEADWLAITDWFKMKHEKWGWPLAISRQRPIRIKSEYGDINGYLDLEYDRHLIDIKYRSTMAPNQGKTTDLVQLAIYWQATDKVPFLVEICKGKVEQSSYHEDVLYEHWLIAIQNIRQMALIANGPIGMAIQSAKDQPDSPEKYMPLRDLPIHNPNGDPWKWWPEARSILKQYVLCR